MLISVWKKKLTTSAALSGGLIGYLLYATTGFTGLAMMTTFFVLAVIATEWKMKNKIKADLYENSQGRRTASQVLANAGVPAVICVWIYFFPHYYELGSCMIASAFAAATSDTLSSEIGNICGKRFYNIITFKKDERGENGVISVEGLIAGAVGSTLIALVYILFLEWNHQFLIIMVAGFLGNIFDSVLGATLERKKILNNNAVNLLNTLFASIIAAFMTI